MSRWSTPTSWTEETPSARHAANHSRSSPSIGPSSCTWSCSESPGRSGWRRTGCRPRGRHRRSRPPTCCGPGSASQPRGPAAGAPPRHPRCADGASSAPPAPRPGVGRGGRRPCHPHRSGAGAGSRPRSSEPRTPGPRAASSRNEITRGSASDPGSHARRAARSSDAWRPSVMMCRQCWVDLRPVGGGIGEVDSLPPGRPVRRKRGTARCRRGLAVSTSSALKISALGTMTVFAGPDLLGAAEAGEDLAGAERRATVRDVLLSAGGKPRISHARPGPGRRRSTSPGGPCAAGPPQQTWCIQPKVSSARPYWMSTRAWRIRIVRSVDGGAGTSPPAHFRAPTG